MIGKLQRKFVAISMLATVLVTGTIFGMITVESYRIMNSQTDEIIGLIIENNGSIPDFKEKENYKFITQETKFSTRYFTVKLDEDGEIVEMDTRNIAAITQENIENIVNNVLNNRKWQSDYYENYKYKIVGQEDNGKMIVFLDCSLQLQSLESTTQKSVVIIASGLFVVFIFVSVLSRRVLSPIIENIEQQKQFITNAGHELKTPLAVIMADIDVLEMTMEEENEWVISIKNQANRLNTLIKNLLDLSNVQEGKSKLQKSEFSITDLLKEQIGEFKALLKEKQVEFVENEEEVRLKANVDMMKQLIIILLDNARKYTPDNGKIEINIKKQRKNVVLEISNDCENVKNVNVSKLFDRFYREDKSHNNEKEGYGIGLSIAKSIVDLHHGKISAYVKSENSICFKIVLPEMAG